MAEIDIFKKFKQGLLKSNLLKTDFLLFHILLKMELRCKSKLFFLGICRWLNCKNLNLG